MDIKQLRYVIPADIHLMILSLMSETANLSFNIYVNQSWHDLELRQSALVSIISVKSDKSFYIQ